MNTLFRMWDNIQLTIFPWLEEELGPLTEKEKQLIQIISIMDPGRHMHKYTWERLGRKPKSRQKLLKAFVAKAVFNFETTKLLITYLNGCKSLRSICGYESKFELPSEATFSRAFDEFSKDDLLQRIHAHMIDTNYKPKIAGHISRDSTDIPARERPAKKVKLKSKPKRKRGRPKKGEKVPPKPKKRVELQLLRSFEENLKELPSQCDIGTKKNSKGYKKSWIGYKLHIDCIDGDIPVSTILTSASTHDSQVSIPLAQMSSQRVTNLYDLMDAAYDVPQIHEFSRQLKHVPIIDHNPRRSGEKKKMEPPTQVRYKERSSVERVNSYLKDTYGGRHIRVQGASKVMAHLMFGIIAITAMQLFRLLPA